MTSHNHRFTWLAAALLSIVSGAAHAEDTQPDIDEKSRQVLQAMSDYYAKTKTMSVKIDYSLDAQFGDQPKQSQGPVTCQFQFKRPGCFRLEGGEDRENRLVLCEGKTTVTYMSKTNRYAQLPVEPAMIPMHPVLSHLQCGPLISDNPMQQITPGLVRVRYAGIDQFGNESYHHLKLTGYWSDSEMWIHDGEQPTIYMQMTNSERTSAVTGGPVVIIATLQFYDWQIDQPIDDAVFKFTPPADAKRVERWTRH